MSRPRPACRSSESRGVQARPQLRTSRRNSFGKDAGASRREQRQTRRDAVTLDAVTLDAVTRRDQDEGRRGSLGPAAARFLPWRRPGSGSRLQHPWLQHGTGPGGLAGEARRLGCREGPGPGAGRAREAGAYSPASLACLPACLPARPPALTCVLARVPPPPPPSLPGARVRVRAWGAWVWVWVWVGRWRTCCGDR